MPLHPGALSCVPGPQRCEKRPMRPYWATFAPLGARARSYTRGMELREVAEALYTADPADFVAQRNAAAGKADKALAKDIRGLRKPSASAAAVNALVRAHPDVIDDILAIGDRMREAFADRDRDEIRALTAERQRLLQKALRNAGPLSAAVQREVEDTLQAAVIDAAAAAAVRSGMLVRAIESTGLDQADVTDAVALPVDVDAPVPARERRSGGSRSSTGAKGSESGSSRRSKSGGAGDAGAQADAQADAEAEAAEEASRRRERQRRIRTAEKALERATSDAERLDDELDEEVDRRTDLEAERDTLSRRLERTQEELSESRAAERELRRRITNAQSALREAQKALRAARDD